MPLQRIVGKSTFWLHAIRHLRRLKVLIVPGMGVLDDFGVSPLGWPHHLLSWCVLGRLMGVKIIFASVGAGPIRHPVSRWLMKSAAPGCPLPVLSGYRLEGVHGEHRVRCRNDPIYPDIAFALPAPAARPAGRRARTGR